MASRSAASFSGGTSVNGPTRVTNHFANDLSSIGRLMISARGRAAQGPSILALMHARSRLALPLALILAACSAAHALARQTLSVSPDKPDATYQVGQTMQWRIRFEGEGEIPSVATYSLKRGGLTEIS